MNKRKTDNFYTGDVYKRNLISVTLLSVVTVMTLFMMSVEVRSPLIMETITVPCLKILLRLVKPPAPSSKTNKVGYIRSYTVSMHHAVSCVTSLDVQMFVEIY